MAPRLLLGTERVIFSWGAEVPLLVVSDARTGVRPCAVTPPRVAGAARRDAAAGGVGRGGLHLPGPRSQPRRHLCRRMSVCSGCMHAKIRHFFFLFSLRIPQKANIHER